MLRRCLASANPCFGMIPPPRPTSTTVSPGNDFGTMLQIRNVQMLPDGRSIVETWGTWRFRIMERGMLDGYVVARVERVETYRGSKRCNMVGIPGKLSWQTNMGVSNLESLSSASIIAPRSA